MGKKNKKQRTKSTQWRQKHEKKGDRVMKEADPNDLIICLMGPTGAGKSTFINSFFGGRNMAEVGTSLTSCTRHLAWYTHTLTKPEEYQGRRLVLVDTPGFDDTNENDSEILRRIAVWLAASYEGDIPLAGVIYLHDIAQKRMSGSARMNLRMFESLVGLDRKGKTPAVALVTSQWDTVQPEAGFRREKELMESFWKEPIANGALVCRSDKGTQAEIVNKILHQHKVTGQKNGNMETTMLIQQELVDEERIIPLTQAGQKLRYDLDQLLKYQAQIAKNTDDEAQRKETAERVAILQKECEALKVSIGERMVGGWKRLLSFRR